MFGVMWGVTSIVILSAVGEGFLRGNQKVFKELGKDILIVRNGRTSLQAGGQRAGRPIRLNLSDVYALQEQSKLLEFFSPELMRRRVQAKSAFNASVFQMSGVWPVYQTLRTIEVDRGRRLRQEDGEQRRRVVVVGFEACTQLFGDRDPIGSEIMLDGRPFTVIGRVRSKKQDSNYTGPDNERLFVPYETMRQDFPSLDELDTADSIPALIVAPYADVTAGLSRIVDSGGSTSWLEGRSPVEYEIRSILGARHGFDADDVEAVQIWNTVLQSVMLEKVILAIQEFFVSVSLVTLALGGIGVMNIMLIAVKERTREIGIRKAIGATSRNIQWLFFGEGFFLTVVSGTLGFMIGLGLCALVNLFPMPERFSGMIVTWRTALFSVGTLVLIGVAASTYPARRAARLPPAEALSYDA
jgi:putative ABC transport system permease protein